MKNVLSLVGNNYIEYLTQNARYATTVKIMTFMIYENKKQKVRELLKELNKSQADVEIIVGIPYMFRCVDGCPECFNRSYEQIMELYETADKFKKIKWYFRSDTHCKMLQISFKNETEYWYGSKNITDGNSADLMVKLLDSSQKIEVMALYEKSKRNIMKLNFGKYKENPINLNRECLSYDDYSYINFIRKLGTNLNCEMNTFIAALSTRILEDKDTYNSLDGI